MTATQVVTALLEDDLVHGCSMCKRIRQPDGSYLAQEPGHSNVSHGICPDCIPKMRQNIQAIRQNPIGQRPRS